MVTSSTPMPMPQMKRHRFRLKASCWNAITSEAAAYHSSEPVKMTRRPSRSATKPNKGGADEQAEEEGGDKAGNAGGAEQARRGGGEDARFHQPRRDIGRQEQVVEFEEAAQRQQGHPPPEAARGGKRFQSGRYGQPSGDRRPDVRGQAQRPSFKRCTSWVTTPTLAGGIFSQSLRCKVLTVSSWPFFQCSCMESALNS